MAKKNDAVKAPPKQLLPEVAEKYILKTIRPGKYNFAGFGTIDLRTLKLDKADELVENGFSFLVPKKKKEEPKAPKD